MRKKKKPIKKKPKKSQKPKRKKVYKQLSKPPRVNCSTLEVEKRLTRDEQWRILQWLVELKSDSQIAELVKQEFRKKITRQAVWKYKKSKKWGSALIRLRNRFERNITKIPIANEADRLRVLQKIVDEGMKWSLKSFSKWHEPIYEQKLGAVTQAVKVAQDERKPQRGATASAIASVTNIIYGHRDRSPDSPIRPEKWDSEPAKPDATKSP